MSTAAAASALRRAPGPFQWPLVCNLPLLLKHQTAQGLDQRALHRELYEEHGAVYRFNPLMFEQTFVTTPAFLDVMRAAGDMPVGLASVIWPPTSVLSRHPEWRSDNNLGKNGPEWRDSRRALQPFVFNHATAKGYQPRMVAAAKRASSAFPAAVEASRSDPESLAAFTGGAAFDIFCAFALDREMRASSGEDRESAEFCRLTAEGMRENLALMPFGGLAKHAPWALDYLPPYLRFEKKWLTVLRMSRDIVTTTLREHPNGDGMVHNFVRDAGYSEDQATDRFFSLLLASVDTTGDTLMRALTLLADYPDVQDRLRAEIRDELAGGDYHADAALPYLKAVWCEAERLQPAGVGTVVRMLPEDIELEGCVAPAGSKIFMSKIGVMIDEALAGPAPHEFRPERFLPEAVAARKAAGNTYLDHPIVRTPFSFGPRMCLGARVAQYELNTLMCRLLQDHAIGMHADSFLARPEERIFRQALGNRPSPLPQFSLTAL